MSLSRKDTVLSLVIIVLLAILFAQQAQITKLSAQLTDTQQNAQATAKAILQETAGAQLPEHNL